MKNEAKRIDNLNAAEMKIFRNLRQELFCKDGIWKWQGIEFAKPQDARRHIIKTACRLAAK